MIKGQKHDDDKKVSEIGFDETSDEIKLSLSTNEPPAEKKTGPIVDFDWESVVKNNMGYIKVKNEKGRAIHK